MAGTRDTLFLRSIAMSPKLSTSATRSGDARRRSAFDAGEKLRTENGLTM